jgi:hypothetical protein
MLESLSLNYLNFMSKILTDTIQTKKGPCFSVDAKVINPANYSVLMNFMREGFVAESQGYLLTMRKY